jgi:hypothetical protein
MDGGAIGKGRGECRRVVVAAAGPQGKVQRRGGGGDGWQREAIHPLYTPNRRSMHAAPYNRTQTLQTRRATEPQTLLHTASYNTYDTVG